jgi:hypothetical protein
MIPVAGECVADMGARNTPKGEPDLAVAMACAGSEDLTALTAEM